MRAKIMICPTKVILLKSNGEEVVFNQYYQKMMHRCKSFDTPIHESEPENMIRRLAVYCNENNITIENFDSLREGVHEYFNQKFE